MWYYEWSKVCAILVNWEWSVIFIPLAPQVFKLVVINEINKISTIIPLALVGYEIDIAELVSTISYPTSASGIIVKYPTSASGINCLISNKREWNNRFIKNALKNCNICVPRLFSLSHIVYDICCQWYMSLYTIAC